jgi:hypothetical protein
VTPTSPPELPEAFYHRLAPGRYQATVATAGPWSPQAQHAGPPAALLARAIEHTEPRAGFRVARISIELPRPIPLGELEVATQVVRSGARSDLIDGMLTSTGRPVLLARAARIAPSPGRDPHRAART